MAFKNEYVNKVYKNVLAKDSDQPEFLQAVEEVLATIEPVVDLHPEFEKAALLERIVEPERIITFRVPWVDDKGQAQVNRGYRVQFNSAIGPYKGGTRFHPSVSLSVMKFLGFEQTFKNALTGLPMGGGKGGADFDPKGKSDNEIMSFCQSYITELYRHIGEKVDVPAGDIGVGSREVGYMYGQYKRITGEFTGVFTGKHITAGGSLVRPEATGYGLLYFVREMLSNMKNDNLSGKTVVISGSGNVAIYATEKAQELGAKCVTASDSSGYVYDPNGINLEVLKQIKQVEAGRISEYANRVEGASFVEGSKNIWSVACDIALPCATQNEMDETSAQLLVDNGVMLVAEGANMPVSSAGVAVLKKNNVLYAPGKASNAGGVATSGLEMTQNAMHLSWSFDKVNHQLDQIMVNIFKNSYDAAEKYATKGDIQAGANIAGFLKVAQSMMWQGVSY